MTVSLIVELLLSVLLVATLIYCALLERKLNLLRKGQDGLRQVMAGLDSSIAEAGASVRVLQSAASGALQELREHTARGRAVADELSVLTASAERIAGRMERAAPNSGSMLPPALASRLHSPKAELRSVR